MELKARFDEESNIEWARRRWNATGVHVVYGLVGLKVHCKALLVVRARGRRHPPLRPPRHRQLQRASPRTSTPTSACSPAIRAIGADCTDLFNYLTGYSAKTDYRKLLVAPVNLRERFAALIEREIEHQQERRQRPPDLQDERAGGPEDDPAAVPRRRRRG